MNTITDQLVVREIDWELDAQVLERGMEAFWKETGMAGVPDYDYFVKKLQHLKIQEMATILVVEQGETVLGAAGVLVGPDLFTGQRMASELFLFVFPEYRSLAPVRRLINGILAWSRYQKAQEVRIGHFGGPTHVLGTLYRRSGFEVWHTVYRQRLV